MTLSAVEQRVLGALIEKEITTPEYYPLSLNSLQAATNQRSSRDPVVTLDEADLRTALASLEQLGLVTPVRDSRVPRFEHRARTVLQLRRDETALLCLLLLRGPQTPGELRSRADRLYTFDDLDSVVSTLDRLAARSATAGSESTTGPLTALLPRQPGSRESRYMHLLGPAPQPERATAPPLASPSDPTTLESRVAGLEQRVAALEDRLRSYQTQIAPPSSHDVEPA